MLPSKTLSKASPNVSAIALHLRTVANCCERLRTVADSCGRLLTLRQPVANKALYRQTRRVKREPFATHSGEKKVLHRCCLATIKCTSCTRDFNVWHAACYTQQELGPLQHQSLAQQLHVVGRRGLSWTKAIVNKLKMRLQTNEGYFSP